MNLKIIKNRKETIPNLNTYLDPFKNTIKIVNLLN